jgi:hypothetical protein
MHHRTTDIVAALHEMAIGDKPDLETFRRQLAARFPGITDAEVVHACRVRCDDIENDRAESDVRYQREQRELTEAEHILAGLGAISLDEAVAIKAARGDPIALRWQKAMSTREYRLNEALSEAACQAHPQFEQIGDGEWDWKGDGKMPSDEELIDWFQMTHPTEARRIEARYDAA